MDKSPVISLLEAFGIHPSKPTPYVEKMYRPVRGRFARGHKQHGWLGKKVRGTHHLVRRARIS